MPLEIDLYGSFRSPYSYLATPRLLEMTRAYDLAVNVRPVGQDRLDVLLWRLKEHGLTERAA